VRRRWRGVVSLVVVLWALPAWASTMVVVDPSGHEAVLQVPVERIVTPYAMATYYLYVLGAGERLVMSWYIGVRTLADAPEALWQLEPALGEKQAGGEPNIEELIGAAPDWLIVDALRHAAIADLAEELGVPVTRLAVETPEALLDVLHLLAPPLGEEAVRRAAALGDWQEGILASLRGGADEVDAAAVPRVLFVGTDPLLVATEAMYQTRMIEAAGGTSVTAQLEGYWARIGLEELYRWDPEVIIIPSYSPVSVTDLLEDPDWQAVSAVKNGRVHRMERLFAPWDTPVPDSLLGVLWLAQRLQPGRIDTHLRDEVVRFYLEFYGYRVEPEELDRLCGG